MESKNTEPLTIAIFGKRNVGKSALINLLTGQQTAIVSDIAGTTTDPVRKRMELMNVGVVTLVDTAGIDDTGIVGEKRVRKSLEMVKQADCALLIIAGNNFDSYESNLILEFEKYELPYLIIHNKSDKETLNEKTKERILLLHKAEVIATSAIEPKQRDYLIAKIKKLTERQSKERLKLFAGLVRPKDIVLLITPIDQEAPTDRMILPQNQSIRALLNEQCIVVTIRECELTDFLALGIKPSLVVTDSQAFGYVAATLPASTPLTSFSILFARQKGNFEHLLHDTPQIDKLRDGDKVLILESCTHQTSCDDIGRIKIPRMLRQHTGKELIFSFVSGLSELPESIDDIALVIQCGACMVTRRQLLNRLQIFEAEGIPITNYGMTLAYLNGIFERATQLFR